METKVAIVIRTVDRMARGAGRSYLGETLANLKRGGVFVSPHLEAIHLVQGIPDAWYPDVELRQAVPSVERSKLILHRAEKARTANENATAAHRIGLDSGADWTLFLEDDIDVCTLFLEGVVRWLEEHNDDREFPLYAFGANYGQIVNAMQQRKTAWRYPAGAFYGTQAYAVSREIAATLVPWLEAHPLYGRVTRGHDLRLQQWAREEHPDAAFLASVPSFVQHIGKESGMGCRFFQFRSWPGRRWRYEQKGAA